MQSAATARQVPLELIEATAYVNTRWEWISTPSINHGIGPMNITPAQIDLASSLSGDSQAQISSDLAANLDAGAALVAHYHGTGSGLASYQSAVATTQGPLVANQIYSVLRTGAARTTSTGEAITLAPQPFSGSNLSAPAAASSACAATSPDYGSPACWVPADPSNYSVANRAHDYPIDMIVIHDIEGSYGNAIQLFQTPGFAASANYVVSYGGDVTQMVRESDIAWHAGNWDYNTRSIGIEHEGFAWTPGLYTTAEYNASAAIAASICSRWGVQLDRTHVIGHNEVPDPNNPGLFGGTDHHTDPGPYWNWTYYMQQAQNDAQLLPSPPHMMPDPVATNGPTSVTVSWGPARTCRPATAPITGYTVVGQPGNLTINLPASATSTTFNGLQPGTSLAFTVTATNKDGQDSATSNSSIPGRCSSANLTSSAASPQLSGTQVQFSATSTGCPNPLYQFWTLAPGASSYQIAQAYSSGSTFTWNTAGLAAGTYSVAMWARDSASPGTYRNNLGSWDGYVFSQYALTSVPCQSAGVAASPLTVGIGAPATITGSASGCPKPQYQFWLLPPGASSWQVAQPYSTSATYTLNTTGMAAGTYGVSLWVRDSSSVGTSGNSSGRWDTYSSTQLTLVPISCKSAGVSLSPAGSAQAGTAVTVTGSASGCPSPLYQFWTLAPGASSWQLAQAYSSSATYRWNTTGLAPGSYGISIWVRDSTSRGTSGNTSGRWDTYAAGQYRITSTACSGVTAGASAASVTAGTTVTITATGSGCPNPQYQFWLLAPGASSWQIAQPYSATATYRWNTTGLTLGTYRWCVWVRDSGSAGLYTNSGGSWDAYDCSQTVTVR